MPSLRRVLIVAQPLFIILAFVLLGLLVRSQWDVFRTYEWQVRPRWLLASGLFIVSGWLIEIRMWQWLLGFSAGRLEYWLAVRIWFSSSIVRYIPGNIWQPLSLTMLGRERGIRPEATLASLSLFQAVHVLAVGPIAAFYLATWGRTSALPYWLGSFSLWWSLVVAVPALFFLLRPQSMVAIANFVLTRAGREELPFDLSTGQLFKLLGMSLGAWVFFAAGFTALTAALLPTLDAFKAALPHILAAYPIAFAIGFVSLLTPGGLVVRDGMLFLLLAPVLGREDAMAIAVGMRVWEIALDALATTCAIGIPWLRRVRAFR